MVWKLPISDHACIDLDAPVLAAEEVQVDNRRLRRVWCRHCLAWHYHGPMAGHRIAHCFIAGSPFAASGYNLTLAGAPNRSGENTDPG